MHKLFKGLAAGISNEGFGLIYVEHKEWLWKSCLGAVNHQMCPCAEVAEVWVTACQGTLLSPGNEGLFLSPGARLISISSSTLSAPSPRFAGMQRGAGAKLQGHCWALSSHKGCWAPCLWSRARGRFAIVQPLQLTVEKTRRRKKREEERRKEN